jgi:hypothetical protein
MSQAAQTRQIPTRERHGARLPRGAVLAVASIAQFMVVLDGTVRVL